MAEPAATDPLGIDGNWVRSPLPLPSAAALDVTLCQGLLAIAARHPDRAAIISESERITFSELVGLVGALAEAIRATAAPDGPVALLLPPGVPYIAAWFACAAAGRLLVMVELANPPARNAALLDMAGATLVLHDGDEAAVAATGGRAALCLGQRLAPRPLNPSGFGADEPAFLFATSGSSGIPKLVAYSQRIVQAKVQCSALVMKIEPGDTVMIAGSHANFGVLHHALVFLFSGGTLCLHDMRQGGLSGMLAAVRRFGVDHMRFTPSLFRSVIAMPEAASSLKRLRAIRFAGETLLPDDIARARALLPAACAIENLYGSTESMIFFWSSRTSVLPPGAAVPNGFIYPVAEFLLLEEDGRPAAQGEPGELVISSRHHALGDWIEGRVDRARFPPDPRGDGRRLYYTGDIARLLPDGAMMVLGRKDRLLKINGQRVSLIEIEAVLQTMPGCARVAVLAQAAEAATSLVAFLVLDPSQPPARDPRAWLAERLPRFMLPSRFAWVTEIPLLPGGKVDGQALLAALPPLPALDGSPGRKDDSETVRFLTATWARILRIHPPPPDADFFALGGDSLSLLVLDLAIERKMGRRVAAEVFLRSPTIAGLARHLETGAGSMPLPQAMVPSPRAERFDARGKVTLRKLRSAQGGSRGAVIGMPGFKGGAVWTERFAAHALRDYDIWACAVELDDITMLQDEAWFTCAQEIAATLAAETALCPRALIGFSIGGYLAWLVDRMMPPQPASPRRVISLDSGPVHRKQTAWTEWVESLCPGGVPPKPAEMLLLHRRRPAPLSLPNDMYTRWKELDVALQTLSFRTVDHMDMERPPVIAAAETSMAAFIETGRLPQGRPDPDMIFDTIGGRLYDALTHAPSPDPAFVRRLCEAQALPQDGHLLSMLLFLAIATGTYGEAMALSHRIAEAQPGHRGARYAQVALLHLSGDSESASRLAEAWCLDRPGDSAMRKRPARIAQPPRSWGSLTDITLASDAALDCAIDMLGTRLGQTTGQ